MHRLISEVNKTVRATGRPTRNKKKGTSTYVITCLTLTSGSTPKASPGEVARASPSDRSALASRLKFYADPSLNASEELLLERHVVDKLLTARHRLALKGHEINVQWLSFCELEKLVGTIGPLAVRCTDSHEGIRQGTPQAATIRALMKARNIM
ncbi:hypothetical protein PHPALM_30869 [Phytophthora palmivora]|uniref:Uncharacterized protein n=1 Tax=Phytophthora palmivora TaxID=4796 RepID=A0A2P4X428_9STRA|nr:hypothetical protein PHPALM_30869 [Phytophthora palmivora]